MVFLIETEDVGERCGCSHFSPLCREREWEGEREREGEAERGREREREGRGEVERKGGRWKERER